MRCSAPRNFLAATPLSESQPNPSRSHRGNHLSKPDAGEDRLTLSPPATLYYSPLKPSTSSLPVLHPMAARTAQPVAAMSPVSKMNPTSTEHDFRFPRRPTGRDNPQLIRASDNGESSVHMSLRELGTGLDGAYASASDALLGPAQFPLGGHDDDGHDDGVSSFSQQDEPFASQLFKMLAQHKHQMPNQRRMENMTWRLLSVQMRQQQLEARRQKYDILAFLLLLLLPDIIPSTHAPWRCFSSYRAAPCSCPIVRFPSPPSCYT